MLNSLENKIEAENIDFDYSTRIFSSRGIQAPNSALARLRRILYLIIGGAIVYLIYLFYKRPNSENYFYNLEYALPLGFFALALSFQQLTYPISGSLSLTVKKKLLYRRIIKKKLLTAIFLFCISLYLYQLESIVWSDSFESISKSWEVIAVFLGSIFFSFLSFFLLADLIILLYPRLFFSKHILAIGDSLVITLPIFFVPLYVGPNYSSSIPIVIGVLFLFYLLIAMVFDSFNTLLNGLYKDPPILHRSTIAIVLSDQFNTAAERHIQKLSVVHNQNLSRRHKEELQVVVLINS